ncbi:MAG: glycosyl transferase family 1 [Desulfovibrio sp.]|nr:glycosyl transferase family 1 [Desulfovibrio sp.]
MNETVYLVVSLDVEEEGLFGGTYARRGYTTTNTVGLKRLEVLCHLGVKPTLFCAYSVMTDAASRAHVAKLRERHDVELGAHLHHWNTPPLSLEGNDASLADVTSNVPACAVADSLMAAKLHTLLETGRNFLDVSLSSFRMGRWDARRSLWPLLAEEGIVVDASVRPLHGQSTVFAEPDHFEAPNEPYWIATGKGNIFEVPLTVTPLLSGIPAVLRCLPEAIAARLRSSLRHWGVLALLPVYHPLWLMKLVTSLYVGRGGRVLSLTWHSSEMVPGATPHLPDARAVESLLAKIVAWLRWLFAHYAVRCLTMGELAAELGPAAPVATGFGDWNGVVP